MTRTIIAFFMIVGMLAAVPAVWAADAVTDAPAVTTEAVVVPPTETEPVVANKSVTALKATATLQIKTRIGALTRLTNKVATRTDLSAGQKAALRADIKRQIDALSVLRDKIAKESNLEALKKQFASIYRDYRINGIVMPRVEALMVIYRQQAVLERVATHRAKLEAIATEWQVNGEEVSAIKTELMTASQKLESARSAFGRAQQMITEVSVGAYPAKGTFESAREQLKQGAQYLKDARVLVQKTVTTMKKMEKTVSAKKKSSTSGSIGISPVVTVTDKGFMPTTVKVKVGTTVVFKNNSTQDMWVASDNHPTHRIFPEFDQGTTSGPGTTYSYKFMKKGTWNLHNHVAPLMVGAVVVE